VGQEYQKVGLATRFWTWVDLSLFVLIRHQSMLTCIDSRYAMYFLFDLNLQEICV
jgi:hypothetical protein